MMGGLALALALVATVAATARADRIRELSGIGHDGQITGMGAKGLIIKDADGVNKEVPLALIKDIQADQFPNLAKAEAAYTKGIAGDAASLAESEKFYSTTLATSTTPEWLRLLSQIRLYRMYVDSNRSMEALDTYLGLARANAALVAGVKLPSLSTSSDVNKAMLKKVQAAVKDAAGKPYVGELQRMQTDLLAMEGNPADALAALEPLLKSTDPKTRATAVLKQAELLVALRRAPEAGARLAEAGPTLGDAYAADVAYWHGRILKDTGKNMEAAVEFMRVAILYPIRDKNRTAESLWQAGQAMEAAKASKADVRKVYQEAVGYAGTAYAEKAKAELTRLGTN